MNNCPDEVQYTGEERLLYLSQAIEQSPSSVVITDLEGNITYVNPKFCEVTGYSRAEVQGQNPRVLKSGEQPPEVYEKLWKTIKAGQEWRGEFHNKKKSGELYWEFASISPLRNACGTTTGFLAIKEDITNRKEISEALEKAEACLRQEILLAGNIQRSFLPRTIDNQRIQVQFLYEPYYFVSGDTLDYFWLEGGRKFAGYIVDVMGHGVATALQTSALRVLGRQVFEHEGSLADRIQFFNSLSVSCFTEDSFAALIAFEFDFSTSQITYVSAGINYFLAHTAGRCGMLKVPGTFLGMLPEVRFEEHTMMFAGGDRFYFFSDGLYDLMDDKDFTNGGSHEAITEKLTNLATSRDRMDDATAVFIQIPK